MTELNEIPSLNELKKPYHRLNVYDYVMEFCGWEPIEELIKYAGSPRNELYLTCLIKTGGRAGEVLGLEKENFSENKRQKTVLCQNMKLEKRWKKMRNLDGTYIRQHIEAVRKPFPILIEEPLSELLLSQLQNCEIGSSLFTSPYNMNKSLTVSWGYKLIRKISDELPRPLFNRLGLNIPFTDKVTGNKLSDTIHLWQHWFRSERASQLRSEYNFSEADLMEFFGWLDYRTALHYGRLGASNLAKKMRAAIS
jgi:integrase